VTQPPPNYPPPGDAPPGYRPNGGYAVPYAPPIYRPKPTGPGGAPLAEFGDRLLAYLLDGLILFAILLIPMLAAMVPLFIVYFRAVDASMDGRQPNLAAFFLTFIAIFVVSFGLQFLATYLYQVTYQLKRGQTVGKRVMKLKIVDAETGAPMDLSGARKRWIIALLMSFVGVAHLLDGLWQLWDPQKQTLHDKVARTVVVKVPA
jgi:uncharacterized RDD family membrane protein YckC